MSQKAKIGQTCGHSYKTLEPILLQIGAMRQGDEVIDFGDQEVKGQGHEPLKLDLEA